MFNIGLICIKASIKPVRHIVTRFISRDLLVFEMNRDLMVDVKQTLQYVPQLQLDIFDCYKEHFPTGLQAQPSWCRSLGINNAECIPDIDSDDCDFGSWFGGSWCLASYAIHAANGCTGEMTSVLKDAAGTWCISQRCLCCLHDQTCLSATCQACWAARP